MKTQAGGEFKVVECIMNAPESIHRLRGPCLLGCLGAKMMMMRYEQLFPVLGGLCLKAEEHDVEFVERVCTPHKSELIENRVIQRKIKKTKQESPLSWLNIHTSLYISMLQTKPTQEALKMADFKDSRPKHPSEGAVNQSNGQPCKYVKQFYS